MAADDGGAAHPGAAARLEAPMRPAEPKAKPRAAKRGAGAPSAQQRGRRSLEDRSNSPNNAEPLWGFWKDVSVAQAKRLEASRTADAAVAKHLGEYTYKPSPRSTKAGAGSATAAAAATPEATTPSLVPDRPRPTSRVLFPDGVVLQPPEPAPAPQRPRARRRVFGCCGSEPPRSR